MLSVLLAGAGIPTPAPVDLRVRVDRARWSGIDGGHLRGLDAIGKGLIEGFPDPVALRHFVRHFDGAA
jgi:hypothetical protein